VPEGANAAYLRSLSMGRGENEMLLDAGSSFRVVEYRAPSGPNEKPFVLLEMTP
jgi:hypothetical protein